MLARITSAVATASLLLAAGCVDDKTQVKGQVDNSTPPTTPTTGNPSEGGKADSDQRIVAIAAESSHPYANNTAQDFPVDLAALPSCAFRARLHFSSLRVEAGYDSITISGPNAGDASQVLDGNHDDSWSSWFNLDRDSEGRRELNVRLDSDYSITDYGFAVDAAEWEGAAICPAVVYPPCEAGLIDISPPVPVCGCKRQPVCVQRNEVVVQHQVSRGFNNTGKMADSTDAITTRPGPADGVMQTRVGTLDANGLATLLRNAAQTGVLYDAGYDSTGDWTEYFSMQAGDQRVVFRAPLGEHTPAVTAIINEFLNLFDCTRANAPLVCGDEYTCSADGDCIDVKQCICTEQYAPVCGTNGRTFSNACKAGCANATVAHTGECGSTGDMCGGLVGLACLEDYKCRYGESQYSAPFPDAAGACVADNYCDAPADCSELNAPGREGIWNCTASQCEWQPGSSWQAVPGFDFASAHPYANDANVWKQLYAPAGANSVRLSVSSFDLENNYDFLEVWSWNGTDWERVARFTGATGPTTSDVFAGRYHYLHFVSDFSVTRAGFVLSAEYE